MRLESKRVHSGRRSGGLCSGLLHRSTVAAAVAAMLAGPNIVWAQSAEATLRGTANPNAVITARNVNSGAVRRTTAAATGYYTLTGLPPGTYQVDAGPGTEETVTLSVSSTATFDFTGSASRRSELAEVVVSGNRLVELRTSEVGNLVSLHQIEVLPQMSRNFLEFADTVPGMTFTQDSKGNTSIRGGAQVDSNVNVYIDGVGMKDYVTGGITGQSGAQKSGDAGNPFPQLALQEYKVITSNYKAEYDQVASAAITAQTKSGTNVFTGEAFGNFTNQNLRAATPAENGVGGTKQADSATVEYGLAAGGPIIRDVAHFFVAYEHKDFALPNVVFPPGQNGATVANLRPVLPPDVFAQYGPTTNPFDEDLIFAKIDFEPTDHDRFELTNLTRIEDSTYGASGQAAASAAYDYKDNEERIMLLWQHAADRWVNEVRLTYENTLASPEQTSGNPAITYTWFAPTGQNSTAIQINGQDPRSYFRYEQQGYAIQDDFTLSSLTFLGDHTVKGGVKLKAANLTARDAAQAANYYYAVDSTGTSATPFQATFSLTNPGQDITATSDDRQIGVYLQDDWQPFRRLTLNLGLRWDYETVPAWENFQLPAYVVSALDSPYPGATGVSYSQALRQGGVDVRDYVSTGRNRSAPTDEWQPRVGFSFDLTGEERHVLFGGYGRSYDRNAFDTMSLERSKLAIAEPTIGFYGTGYTLNGCRTPAQASPTCMAWNPDYMNLATLQAQATGALGEVNLVNNKLRNPYSDQFSLGIRDRLGDWNTSIAVAQINSYDVIIGRLGNRYADGAFYQNGSQWGSSGVPGIGNLILWDNAARDRNTEVLVSADKPYTKESHWGATIAYTFSHALQNNPYSYTSNNNYEFDLPTPGSYPMLPSSVVPRHRLVLTGSVDGPWGLLIAAKLSLATPTPIPAIEGCPTDSAPCHGYSVYPTVGYVRDALQERNLDLQVTKNIDLPYSLSAYLRLDMLNVLNRPYWDPGAATFAPVGGTAYAPPQYNGTGPILGVPREIKLSGGVKW